MINSVNGTCPCGSQGHRASHSSRKSDMKDLHISVGKLHLREVKPKTGALHSLRSEIQKDEKGGKEISSLEVCTYIIRTYNSGELK